MRFSASVDADASIRVHDQVRLLAWLTKRPGQRIEVDLRDEAAIHTDRQRRYWFGCVVKTVNEIKAKERNRTEPYPKEAIHAMLMRIFCRDELTGPEGTERPSFSALPKPKVSLLIDDVKEWLWQDYRVHLPDPDEWQDA